MPPSLYSIQPKPRSVRKSGDWHRTYTWDRLAGIGGTATSGRRVTNVLTRARRRKVEFDKLSKTRRIVVHHSPGVTKRFEDRVNLEDLFFDWVHLPLGRRRDTTVGPVTKRRAIDELADHELGRLGLSGARLARNHAHLQRIHCSQPHGGQMR